MSAGGAYCTPDWRPENPALGCASQIVIAPGNDSRVNLFLLMQDQAGADGAELGYPDHVGWRTFYGRNFLRWEDLRSAWFQPAPDAEEEKASWSPHDGDRCQTIETGRAPFLTALQRENLDDEARSVLTAARERLAAACENGPGSLGPPGPDGYFVALEQAPISDPMLRLAAYLEASASFYSGQWARAEQYYGMLSDEDLNPWLAETSRYMIGRTRLNATIASADDQWGWFDVDKTDGTIARRTEEAFRAYLKNYPQGSYASSARGLIRKALWLQRDYGRLGEIYSGLLQQTDPAVEAAARLVEEIDSKWLMREPRGASAAPLLLAADDLLRMRGPGYDPEPWDSETHAVSFEDIDAQAEVFTEHPDLFSLIKANHAFYIAQNYRLVLNLLPADLQHGRYPPVAFSRQFLRGLALHALGDSAEEDFWLQLIAGAQGLYQRPAVELALARLYEQQGRLEKVFALGSPITDAHIRRILLGASAGVAILKQQAHGKDVPVPERAFALFTALLRQLRHGEFDGFVEDYPLTSNFTPDAGQYGLWGIYDADVPPLDLFTAGRWSDGYPCPAILDTVQTLASDAQTIDARLCLGDFYRLNGFDDFSFREYISQQDGPPPIGTKDFYKGTVIPRHAFYTAILADDAANFEQRAYALYRAVRCYAPANRNTCGGEDVDVSQRKAWFDHIKRDYGNSRWARKLRYYW